MKSAKTDKDVEAFLAELKKSGDRGLIMYTTDGCIFCSVLARQLRDAGILKTTSAIKVNIDKLPDVSKKAGHAAAMKAVPVLDIVTMRNGQPYVIATYIGALGIDQLEKLANRLA